MIKEVGKVSAIASVQVDPKKYSRLLAKTLPRAIDSEEENDRMLAIVNRLMRKGEGNLTPEEEVLLELLFTLIEKFEADYYQLEKNSSSTPVSVLKELMSARDLRPKDLWEVLGSRSLTSEILNGHRTISKSKAKALAHFFHVSAELFI
jgi:HTH-type transcriptional regulator/antitoxin HigA